MSETPTPTPTPTPDAGATTQTDWTTGLNEDLKGFVQTKGFKDPATVLESYRNLEKLHGVPKERLLKLPEKDDAPEWGEIYERLGKPKDPNGYEIKPPEGVQADEKFTEFSKKMFHELGLTKKQGEAVASKWIEYATGHQKSALEAQQAKFKEEADAIRKEWGNAFEQNAAVVEQAASQFGATKEDLEAFKQVMGPKRAMEFFHKIGKSLGEDSFVGGDGKRMSGHSTPAAAKSEIEALKKDPGFAQKLVSGDAEAKAKWNKLHQDAFGADNQTLG